MKLLLISLLIAGSLNAQQKQVIDSSRIKDSISIVQTINLIVNVKKDMQTVLYGKASKDYYEAIENLFEAYLIEKKKQFNKNK